MLNRVLLLAFCGLCSSETHAQAEIEWGAWMALGPLENPSGHSGVREELGPEKDMGRLGFGKLGPRFEAKWEGKGGASIVWQPAVLGSAEGVALEDEAVIDLTQLAEGADTTQSAAYLYRELQVEEDVSVPVLFAADDGFTAWLNGSRLLAHDGAHKLVSGEFSAALDLRKGRNHLLIKVVNGDGAWAFQMLRDATSLAKVKASLDHEVDKAIERGVEYLLKTQYPDGSWDFHTYPYRNGQTALSLYALLKSGVPPTHPACVRAVEYLKARRPVRTYSAACHLMAFEAMHDEALLPEIEAIAELLLEWREGGFAYPQAHVDLSNTQYGALGLRAAALAGVKIKDRVWSDLASHTLIYQSDDGGFGYLPGGAPSGSMTAAGLTVFGIAREMLGDKGLPGRLEAQVERSTEDALGWLADRWSVAINPAPEDAAQKRWHPYYLYGLERVGGLLQLDRIGPFDWYQEGARRLVSSQGKEGQWATAYGEAQPNTAFSLLFLERATSVVSGDRTRTKKGSAWGSDDPATPLSLRASGEGPVSIWISSWGDATRADHAWAKNLGAGLRVRSVEYLVDGVVAETVIGNPDQAAGIERFPVRLTGLGPGKHVITARVTLAKPPPDSKDVVIESPPLEISLKRQIDPSTLTYGRDAADNLLRDASYEVSGSSIFSDSYAAARALDGRMSSCWLSANTEGQHALTLELDRALKADTLLLSQALPHVLEPKHVARVTKVQLILNNNERKAIEVDVNPDALTKTEIDLGRPTTIRRLELRVLSYEKGERQPHAAGFAEVELLRRGDRR